MNLLYRIAVRLSICFTLILSVWAVFFYFMVMDEVVDETDDLLEDYSEQIMIRALAGEQLPSKNTASNNQYYLTEVSEEYANQTNQLSFKDSMVYIPYKRETEPARILTTIFRNSEDRYYELTVSIPTIEKEDLRQAILYWIILLYFFLLVVIIIVNVLIYKNNLKPLHIILSWLDSYQVGGKNQALQNKTSIKEFARLNHSVQQSMQRAEVAFENQKQFIGNASHEMQTPIAICLNRIEMLMDDDNLTESQLEELLKTHQTLHYITKLNKSLLLLSKIDNNQFAEKRKVNCNNLLKNLVTDYQEIYGYLNLQFTIHQEQTLYLTINDTLVSILFNNLLKNSCLHNIEGGHVYIAIYADRLVVKNTGEETALDPNSIFDRFYQGNKRKESTGLGLAIVKSICNIENLNISYSYIENQHCFELSKK